MPMQCTTEETQVNYNYRNLTVIQGLRKNIKNVQGTARSAKHALELTVVSYQPTILLKRQTKRTKEPIAVN